MLLKIIAGVEQADEGAIMLKKGLTLGYLDQIPIYPKEYTVIDVLNVAFKDIDIKEEKLSKVCIGMNFSQKFLKQAFDTLSGGERTTIILGKILLENPNLLLLDEPTNHLDMKTVEWLEEYLKNYKGMVLIVSHDRYFINKLCSKVVDLESEKFTNFPGNYEYYREKRDENKQVEEVKTKFKKEKPDKIQSEDKKREIKRIKLEEMSRRRGNN